MYFCKKKQKKNLETICVNSPGTTILFYSRSMTLSQIRSKQSNSFPLMLLTYIIELCNLRLASICFRIIIVKIFQVGSNSSTCATKACQSLIILNKDVIWHSYKFNGILYYVSAGKKYLRSFSPFRRFKKGSCQFLAKECAQYWLTA